MLPEKRSFFSGMNGDISPRLLDDKSSLNIMNARQGSSAFGRSGRLENLPGSTLITQSVYPPYGTQQTIGSTFDARRGRLIYVNYSTSDDHGIYAYDLVSEITYAVLYDSQVTGGLGLSQNSRIDRNIKVIGDLLYWTDDLNRQRKINIESGIKTNLASYDTDYDAYEYPMNPEVISLLKRPPLVPLIITKTEQTSPVLDNNFIRNFAGQFLYRYYYKDGETSVVSVYSELAPYNSADQDYNAIDVIFPLNEYIDQDVQRIDLIVREGNTNNFYVIRSWNKDIYADDQAIISHNAGTTALTYRFYNDRLGEFLDYPGYVFKPFDSVPIKSKTLEIAKNRLYLGNNVIGYDTPIISSLGAVFQTQTEGATVSGTWWELQWRPSPFGSPNTYYVLYLDSIGADNGYYGYLPFPGPTGTPSSPPFLPVIADYPTELALAGYNYTDVLLYFSLDPAGYVNFIPMIDVAEITNPPSTATLVGEGAFKDDASYQIGIVFYDFGDRKCGVLSTDDLILTTPDRTYDAITFTVSLDWSLANTNAVNEIPDWATHYSIVITKCLTTRYFVQSRVKNITYATKDEDGLYLFNTDTYDITNNGVALDITLLNGYGMGYVFADGDLVKVYIDGDATVYTLAIIAQDGNWIVAELQDLGTLGDTAGPKTDALFEIYTPYRASVTEPFYEVGQTFTIDNPGELTREYSTLNGSIGGDITMLNRSDGSVDYLTQNMSPNDKFYLNWYTDSGRANFVSPIGQTEEPNTVAFSNTYIIGSRLNGLSSFDPLSEKEIPLECGEIQKLQLTSKVQNEQGVVMLAICQRETASLYLGEVQQYGSNQQTTLTVSEQVIGTINVLKGSRGTSNPETVIAYKGMVDFLDVINGKWVQYSNNGLEDVSAYGQERLFKRYCDEYFVSSPGNLDNINGFHHIPTCIDPFHKEFIVTLPALIYENYANILPSYGGVVPDYATSILDRFDIFDQLGKTMAFQFENNIWGNNYEWTPEWWESGNNGLFAFKNGYLYSMYTDTTNWNTVFGVQYPVRICTMGNANPSALKVLNSTALESNAIPDYTVALTTWPNTQITDLAEDDWVDDGGVYYASFLKDRLSPNSSGTADEKLYDGDDLTDFVLAIMYEFQQYDALFFCNFIDISYSYSRGNKPIMQPINQ